PCAWALVNLSARTSAACAGASAPTAPYVDLPEPIEGYDFVSHKKVALCGRIQVPNEPLLVLRDLENAH
ncbi:MAG TPA: hypothetical protein PKJ53_01675, partial [Spirochaetales bacterium]|nr:hypothetical protein [Spirochaetales bacterium]